MMWLRGMIGIAIVALILCTAWLLLSKKAFASFTGLYDPRWEEM